MAQAIDREKLIESYNPDTIRLKLPDQIAFSQQLITWWMSNKRKFPWRKQLPLWKALLVEVMLQRTKADQVREPFIRLDSKNRTIRCHLVRQFRLGNICDMSVKLSKVI